MSRFSLILASICATAVSAISMCVYSERAKNPSISTDNEPIQQELVAKQWTNNASDSVVAQAGTADLPGPNQTKIEEFLLGQGYKDWDKQPAHLSGRHVGRTNYAVHGYIQVYFSSGIKAWINEFPAKSRNLDAGEMIVALEYAPTPSGKQGELRRILSMVRNDGRQNRASFDGWFWSTTYFNGKAGTADWTVDQESSKGQYGASECLACHAAANNDGLVFLSKKGPLTPENSADLSKWHPDPELKWPDPDPPPLERQLLKPLAAADPEFLKYFDVPDVREAIPFPKKALDHVFPGNYAGMKSMKEKELYITSDQCIGCHNAAQLLSNSSPNMWYPEPDPETTLVAKVDTPDSKAFRNFSPYGEWSASLNALSGRDPVWHAQVDFERKLRPKLAHFTTDTCFICHGPMAGRQLKVDKGADELFTIDKFYAKPGEEFAKYGALARDGVSCAVCHQIPAKNLGEDPKFKPRDKDVPGRGFFVPADLKSYTAMFGNPSAFNNPGFSTGSYFGPYKNEDVLSSAMDRGLGQKGAHGPPAETTMPQIHESRLCGTCHTVLVPALPVGYEPPAKGTFEPGNQFGLPKDTKMSFEQTTYFEWRNSRFENETEPKNRNGITCQNCHMASHRDLGKRIVNLDSNRFPPVRDRAEDQRNRFKVQTPIYRHVLLGINFFVFEMYEQFPKLLGSKLEDPRVPKKTLDPVLNARDWIENHAKRITAEVRITDIDERRIVDGKEHLEVKVEITNYAGHKFPTGAGFRRAFLHFEVLGADDKVLWASGRTNSLGVILGADGKPLESEETLIPGKSAPHQQIITSQDEVQIYETRALDSGIDRGQDHPDNRDPQLQTTVLGIYYEYKDNRIPPLGYTPPTEHDIDSRVATGSVLVGDPNKQPVGVKKAPPDAPEEATHHPTVFDGEQKPRFKVIYDPNYWSESAKNGQDHIRYRIPLDKIKGWTTVKAQLYYQTIPPYYLRDRFETDIPEDKRLAGLREVSEGDTPTEDDKIRLRDKHRLIHIASRLNLKGTPAENWSLKIADAAVVTKQDGKIKGKEDSLSYEKAWGELTAHYNYLDFE